MNYFLNRHPARRPDRAVHGRRLPDRRQHRHGDRARGRRRPRTCSATGTPTRWCCRCTAPQEVDDAVGARISTAWSRELAQRAGLPMPQRLHHARGPAERLRDRPQPGERRRRGHHRPAATCLTAEEVAGVMAHELAHVKNRDTLIMTITATIAGAISMLAQFRHVLRRGNRENNGAPSASIGSIAMVILAPDRRHDRADGDQPHARIRGRPDRRARSAASRDWLASALQKIAERGRTRSRTTRPSAIPRPRTCSSSTRSRAHGMDNLFSTHPATENRVAALMELARRWAAGLPPGDRRGSSVPRRPSVDRDRGGPWGRTRRRTTTAARGRSAARTVRRTTVRAQTVGASRPDHGRAATARPTARVRTALELAVPPDARRPTTRQNPSSRQQPARASRRGMAAVSSSTAC